EVEGDEAGITYDKTVQEVEVTVKKVSATELKATASKEAKDLVFKNIYTPAKTEVSVKKVWKDADNQDGKRPTSITVKLLADGQDTGKTLELTEANGWAGSFTDLDADKGGKAIAYTVIETTKVEGYISEVTGDATSGFTITNSYTPETIDITVTKNWNDADNQDGKRPDKITVNLLADGTKIDSKEVQAATDGTWSVEFTKLAKFKDGKEIKYTVTEEAVAGYKSSIDNFTITNSHDPEKINISGTKVWNDNNDQDGKRPTKITVQVLKGEQVVAEMEVSAETDWKFEFKDLPKYEKGKEITYELKEVSVEHYTTKVTEKDGKYTITNTHTPAKINVKGQKIWDDANNKDGIRPDSIVVKLLANGVETGKTATASVASGWTYEFTDLDRYQDGGKEIVYTVKEAYVPKGYTSEVIGTNIVNHHKPKDPEPNKPQDPEPNKPKDPEPNKPQDPEPGKPGPKPQLPNTGEKASNVAVVAGLALMAVTGGLYFVSRKNK
ncbi:Cna B-type domain-containing protein, partial [Streptococcus oralis]|uniref:Cna B-type domain-containing protein n=1 Tax=Streptococcus oralis TaxID=1303 RepID=UPI0010099A96